MTHQQEIHARLEQAAFAVTDNFCYSCYKVIKADHCPDCGSDDFMRHLSGVGVEYGTDWVIEHLIQTHCNPVDGDEMYEELLDECWPEVTIGCGTYSPSQILKNCDEVAFEIGVKENLDNLAEDGVLYEVDGDYYRLDDIDQMLSDLVEAK
jgi:hypothetical protein